MPKESIMMVIDLQMMLQIVMWTMVFIDTIGNFMVSAKNINGFYVRVAADIVLISYNLYIGIYFMGVLLLIHAIIAGYGIFKWRA